MKLIVYEGPHAAVDIPAVNKTLRRGEPTQVSDKVAKVLLAKPNIKIAPDPTASSKEND